MPAHPKYKPEYCAELIAHMKTGYSFTSFASKIGVNRRSLQRWVKDFPEFEAAYDEAKSHALLYFERQGIEGMLGLIDGFNATVWIFTMKNRFGWKDRQEKVRYIIDGKEISEEEMRAELLKHYQELNQK